MHGLDFSVTSIESPEANAPEQSAFFHRNEVANVAYVRA